MGKDWKSCEWAKLTIPSHSEPLWWEKIGKVASRTKFNLSSGVGGGHQPEPQFQLNLKNRGFLFSVFHQLEMYVCNEGGGGVDW